MGKHKVKSEVGSRKSEVKRAVFLDRDGVINRALEKESKPYPPTSLAEFEILPEVPAACAKLKAAGFLLVVATNQPDVGRGTLKQEVVEKIHAHMTAQLPIDRVEVCYHAGKGLSDCDCRKPKPGMLLHARANSALTSRKAGWSATAGATLIAATPPAAKRFSLIAATRRN
jgi:histidinol-phosphate phosphatase family protein